MQPKYGVLALVALVVLTGCLDGVIGDNNGNGAENIETEGEAVVGVAVAMDPAEQEQIFENIDEEDQQFIQEVQQAQMMGEEVSEEDQERAQEIIQEIEQAEQQASQEAMDTFEATVEESETLAIEDSMQAQGESIYLISGSAEELIGLLDQSGVQAMVSEDTYQQAIEAQQQQQQMPAPEGGAPAPAPTP